MQYISDSYLDGRSDFIEAHTQTMRLYFWNVIDEKISIIEKDKLQYKPEPAQAFVEP